MIFFSLTHEWNPLTHIHETLTHYCFFFLCSHSVLKDFHTHCWMLSYTPLLFAYTHYRNILIHFWKDLTPTFFHSNYRSTLVRTQYLKHSQYDWFLFFCTHWCTTLTCTSETLWQPLLKHTQYRSTLMYTTETLSHTPEYFSNTLQNHSDNQNEIYFPKKAVIP